MLYDDMKGITKSYCKKELQMVSLNLLSVNETIKFVSN